MLAKKRENEVRVAKSSRGKAAAQAQKSVFLSSSALAGGSQVPRRQGPMRIAARRVAQEGHGKNWGVRAERYLPDKSEACTELAFEAAASDARVVVQHRPVKGEAGCS